MESDLLRAAKILYLLEVELGRSNRMDNQYLKEERLYRILHDNHYEGIGPQETETQVPTALRSTVDKPKEWYRTMFKAMHKAGRSGQAGDSGVEYDEQVFSKTDENCSNSAVRREKHHPGSISDWTPGPAYVSENVPVPHLEAEGTPKRRSSARGEAAKESVAEVVSKPWQNYFDDIEQPNVPINLLENPKKIQGLNPKPIPPLQPISMLDNVKHSNPHVTPAPKTVGPYLQTSTRQLIPDKNSDAEIYAPGTNGNYQHRGNVTPCLAIDGRFLEPVLQRALELRNGPSHQEKRQTAKMLFNFKARSIRELSVNKDDQVICVKDINEKWVECESKGRTGIIPKSYLEYNTNPFRVIQYGKATARYDFKRKSNRQLSFDQDTELILIKRVDQNWYEARINNSTKGLVPANHLSVSIEPVTTHDNNSNNSDNESLSPAPSVNSRPSSLIVPLVVLEETSLQTSRLSETDNVFRKVSVSAQNELNAAVDELSDLSIKVNEELDQTLQEQAEVNDDRPPWVPQQSERFQAIYSFKPQHDDELELGEGDVVYVFEKCLDGWYIGAHGSTGAIGTFPGNYTIAN